MAHRPFEISILWMQRRRFAWQFSAARAAGTAGGEAEQRKAHLCAFRLFLVS